jgi:putative inorganic carbon (hco3(-)) transporter
MFGTLDARTRMLITRELAFATLALAFVIIPALFSIGIAAWVAIGSLLAFAVVHPRALIFAVPAAIPLSFQPVSLGELQFNALEILVVAAAIGYAPRVVMGFWRIRSMPSEERYALMRQVFPDLFAAALAITLVMSGVISIFWMADPTYAGESLRTFRWTILVPVAYFFIAAPVISQNPLFRRTAAGLFIAGAIAASLIAIGDAVLGGGLQVESVTRLAGIAPHPNALALVLDRAAVLGLLIALLLRTEISRYWLVPSALVVAVTLLTFSRGAMLGMAIGLLLLLLLSRATRPAIAIAGITLAGLAWFAVLAPERALSLLSGGSGSMRLELWESSLTMITDHSLTGVGMDQFLYQYLPRYVSPEAWPERFTSHPHNLLLDSWLSLGIIGVVVVALLAVLVIRRSRTAVEVGDRISLAAAGAIVTVAVHGMVDHSYFLPELAMSAWLLLILLIPEQAIAKPSEPDANVPESEGLT